MYVCADLLRATSGNTTIHQTAKSRPVHDTILQMRSTYTATCTMPCCTDLKGEDYGANGHKRLRASPTPKLIEHWIPPDLDESMFPLAWGCQLVPLGFPG